MDNKKTGCIKRQLTKEEIVLESLCNTELYACNQLVKNKTISSISAGKGDSILLLHGLGGGWGQWYKNINVLSKNNHVLAPDMPGSGMSDSINLLTADFKSEIVEPLALYLLSQQLNRTCIIGHSFGAWIAVNLIRLFKLPVNKLVLVNPVGWSTYIPMKSRILKSNYLMQFIADIKYKKNTKGIGALFSEPLYLKNSLETPLINYLTKLAVRHGVHPLLLMHRIAKETHNGTLALEDNSRFDFPCLVILGENDPLIPYEKIKTHISKLSTNVRIETFESSGHVPPLEEADRFNAKVLEFLEI
jgi:pimeloyl-ACP methyl ester carboxylesterase